MTTVNKKGTEKVTIAIVAYNAGEYLQVCVDALAAQTFTAFKAVVVDNASTDDAVATLSLPDDRFAVDFVGENLGFAKANNRIAFNTETEWFLTLNPDTKVSTTWLEKLLEGTERWPDAVAFGSTQLRLGEPGVLDGAGDVWHAAGVAWRALEGRSEALNPNEGETFAPCGAAALYKTNSFREIGGFDESFFCYCEDVDLGYRFRLNGKLCIQIADSFVSHAGSGTTGRYSDFTIYHGHRNRIWVFVKNTPSFLFWFLLPAHIALNFRILQKSPTPEYRTSLLRAYRAALSGLGPVWKRRKQIQKQRRASLRSLVRAMAWTPKLITNRAPLLDKNGCRVRTSATD